MRGIIFGNTLNKACAKLQEICENYNRANINTAGQTKYSVIFDNGDRWNVCVAQEGSCLLRGNILLIDKDISQNYITDIINTCILPIPFFAYSYF